MVETERDGEGRRAASAVRRRHLAVACAAVTASVTFYFNMGEANPDLLMASGRTRAAEVSGLAQKTPAREPGPGSDLDTHTPSAQYPRGPVPRADAAIDTASGYSASVQTNDYLVAQSDERADNLRTHPWQRWLPVVSLSLGVAAIVPLWLMLGAWAEQYRRRMREQGG